MVESFSSFFYHQKFDFQSGKRIFLLIRSVGKFDSSAGYVSVFGVQSTHCKVSEFYSWKILVSYVNNDTLRDTVDQKLIFITGVSAIRTPKMYEKAMASTTCGFFLNWKVMALFFSQNRDNN